MRPTLAPHACDGTVPQWSRRDTVLLVAIVLCFLVPGTPVVVGAGPPPAPSPKPPRPPPVKTNITTGNTTTSPSSTFNGLGRRLLALAVVQSPPRSSVVLLVAVMLCFLVLGVPVLAGACSLPVAAAQAPEPTSCHHDHRAHIDEHHQGPLTPAGAKALSRDAIPAWTPLLATPGPERV